MKNRGHRGLTRRRFLQHGGLAATALAGTALAPGTALGAAGRPAANDRIGVGVIGIGAMGRGHLHWCLGTSQLQVRAVCDVDEQRRQNGWESVCNRYGHRDCVAYNDYRDLLQRDDIDAVVIATPDHWHSLQAVDAAKAGKDVYVEKPISLTIGEGRRLVDVVRQRGCVLQTGTQYRSMGTPGRIVRYIRRGGLGKIHAVFALWSRLHQFHASYVPVNPDLPSEPVPAGLDWDLWVGPAAWHDYNSQYHRNPIPGVVPWAFCEDFGAASVTYHFSHSADIIQYAIGMERSGPVEVIHPRDGNFPTLTFRYSSGVLLHLIENWHLAIDPYGAVPADASLSGNFGGLFVGDRGWVTTMYGSDRVTGGPDEIFADMGLPDRRFHRGHNHHVDWLDCIRCRGRCSADEEIGHRTASLGHLAIICFKLGRSLKWDPLAERFPDDPEANRLLSRARREPWRA